MTVETLSAFLQCPACGGGLAFEAVPQRASVGAFGLLRCGCATYPVVGDVPILVRGRIPVRSIADARVVADGPTVASLVAQILAGDGMSGLAELLAFPVCPWPLNGVGALRRMSQREPLRSAGLAARRRRVRWMLGRAEALTAEDWLNALYWHSPVPFDPFNYFFYRFGQPRHLAALELLSALPVRDAPVLDLACGYGHVLHGLTAGRDAHAAVGLDQNFHQVWVARHYVAPGAAFVCGDADGPLPFRDGTLSAVVCADAFHYLSDKAGCLAEARRCAAGGSIVLAGTANERDDPDDGVGCSPEGYVALLAPWAARIRGEAELVAAYLDRRGPALAAPAVRPGAEASMWLYAFATADEAQLRDHGPLGGWPHAAGDVQLSPIYEADGPRLTFRFPSAWYASENEAMTAYMPPTASTRDGAEALLSQFVWVGLPERYARPAGRPWTVAANRALGVLLHRLRS